ncbi:hypothetical protein QJQ45_011323 [Haematococcus lacustris]|nr:hypothetical protein QJQ45_011323 [Haematococcus lacustris]
MAFRQLPRQPLFWFLVLGVALRVTFATQANSVASATAAPIPDTTASSASLNNSAAVSDPVGYASLPPFYAVRSCVPFTVLIAAPSNASSDGNGVLLIDADVDVIQRISVSLSNGVLALSVTDDFVTNSTIKCTITPGNASGLSYVQNFGIGDLVVGPGFRSSQFSVSSTGIGSTYVFGLTTSTVRVVSTGSSTVLLNGNVGEGGSLEVGGTSKVYLTGSIAGTLAVTLGGISTTYIQGTTSELLTGWHPETGKRVAAAWPGGIWGAEPLKGYPCSLAVEHMRRTAIQGSVDGLAKVLYTAGTCSIKSPFQSIFGINVFGDPCTKVQAGSAPTFSPVWSCGLKVDGQSSCQSAAVPEASPAPVVTSSAPVVATSSSSGPVTRTVSTPGGSVTTSTYTSGPGASASSGGLVSGSGFPAFGSFQTSIGGFPPIVTPLPGPATAPETPAPTAGTASTQVPPLDLSIPTTSSGMSVVSLACVDPYPLYVLQ